jgi:hypothetical protein
MEAEKALSQSYRYLGKGRQTFVFASADGKWVVKFFNQKYFEIPFWADWVSKERAKRGLRKKFYLESYRIAATELPEETAGSRKFWDIRRTHCSSRSGSTLFRRASLGKRAFTI